MKRHIAFFCCIVSIHIHGQDLNREISRFIPFIQSLNAFSQRLPQEKVYLHFDNTSYYQGDHIWFKCYVVTSDRHQSSPLSKTLYVELLNPGGETVDRRILKIEKGQCHGDFTLNHLPFYSGFYEVRAYTKYMLNFGDDVIFSRLLPIFDRPKAEGNFEEKNMAGYGRYGPATLGSVPMKRERPVRERRVNLRFFPEGGSPVQGITSRVAFEATDEAGNPIDVTGIVRDANGRELTAITTLHEGKGVFSWTPGTGRRREVAEVEHANRTYRFDLPEGLPQGVVMEADNLSHPDSIGITVRKSVDMPAEMFGVAVLNGGKLFNYCFAWIEDDTISFNMDKTRLPAGVSQIVLFNSRGETVCDRLVFTGANGSSLFAISAKTDKPSYRPYEWVELELSLTDRKANPVYTTFSIAVRDGAGEVANGHTILTDLLLMSEIKGCVRNPSYYFENDDDTRRAELDLLLMVQGWRRYAWKQIAGVEPVELKYLPEQGIEIIGQILHKPFLNRQRPRSNADVSLALLQRGEEDESLAGFAETFVTDEQGRFSFALDIEGKWNMILAVTEKGKPQNWQIVLDRLFSPEPKRYRYADLQVHIAENRLEYIRDEIPVDDPEDDYGASLAAYADSLAKLGIDEKVHHLQEVTVTARRTREQDIYRNRSTSIAYYDVASEMDDMYDSSGFAGNNIHELLKNMNEHFEVRWMGNREWILYKGKIPLFVIDYKTVDLTDPLWFERYQFIGLNAIKSVYINEESSVKCQYAYHPMASCLYIDSSFGCVVFIETYPDGEISVEGAKGVRKTWIEGYSSVKEFYSPDYSAFPPDLDYRRTLYWNPTVIPDGNGKATVSFYNNSRSTHFSISAETVTPLGMIGTVNIDNQTSEHP